MILPDLKIVSQINKYYLNSGIDSIGYCRDIDHYKKYPWPIDYYYNSRGFRDYEWPKDFDNSIWCLGDSFTAGIGVPFKHTWPQVLKSQLPEKNVVNISLDGASNEWIARQALYIIDNLAPNLMIIHWSFSTRREYPINVILDDVWKNYYDKIKDTSWPKCDTFSDLTTLPQRIVDEVTNDVCYTSWNVDIDYDIFRRVYCLNTTDDEDLANTQECINKVINQNKTMVIHSFVPNWHSFKQKKRISSIFGQSPPAFFQSDSLQLNFGDQQFINEFTQLDYGRDGYHYDILTANYFVKEIVKLIKH